MFNFMRRNGSSKNLAVNNSIQGNAEKEIDIMNEVNYETNVTDAINQKKEGINMNEANQNEVKMTTGKVVLYRPHINKKWSYDSKITPKFSVIMLSNNPEVLKELVAGVDKAKILGKEKFGDNVQFKSPIKCPGYSTGHDSDIYYQNFYSLKATTAIKPGMVNENKQEITKPDSDIELQYARVSISFYPYCFDDGRAGIACKLHNIQLFKEELDMSQYASNPADDF